MAASARELVSPRTALSEVRVDSPLLNATLNQGPVYWQDMGKSGNVYLGLYGLVSIANTEHNSNHGKSFNSWAYI